MSNKTKRLLLSILIVLVFLGVRYALDQWQQPAEPPTAAAENSREDKVVVTNPLETFSEQTMAEPVAESTAQTTASRQVETVEDLVAIGLLEEIKNGSKTVGWRSPAGLFYGMGSRQGNRVYHVFAHLKPDKSKPIHSVFQTDKAGLIPLIDAAWQLRDTAYSKVQSNGNRIYDVDMGRVIGTDGERQIRIVVRDGSDTIITAYPRR